MLTEIVRHHVKEEEREFLPTLRKLYTKVELEELGEQLATAKVKAEADKHPVSPLVETPLELVASGVAAFTSKAKSIGEGAFTQMRDRVNSE